MRSSAICSCEWFRRSSTKGGCFVIVIIIFNLRHIQLIVSFSSKDEKRGKKFHGLQLLFRNVSPWRVRWAKRRGFSRKSSKWKASGGNSNWRGEGNVPLRPQPADGTQSAFDAWLGKRKVFRSTEFHRNKSNATIHSGTCASGASLR